MRARESTKQMHFIQYIEDATMKHFKAWTKNLLFLSIFSPSPMARCIAQIILGRTVTDTTEYFCEYHNRLIDVRQFANFVKPNCTDNSIMETHTLLIITNNFPAVSMIAGGRDVWTELIHLVLH